QVQRLLLECEDGGTRNDAQSRQLRQIVDETFRDPVTQVLEIRITSGVYERKNSNGVRPDRYLKEPGKVDDHNGGDGGYSHRRSREDKLAAIHPQLHRYGRDVFQMQEIDVEVPRGPISPLAV